MFRVVSVVSMAILATIVQLSAEVKLPTVIGENMVIQRNKPITIWGWADPGENVEVSFAGEKSSAKADAQGNWKVVLKAQKANAKAQDLKINDKVLKNILIGDVWLGSGQSNMEWRLTATADPKKNVAEANHPNIRLFHVKKVQKGEPQKDVVPVSTWKECSPKTIPSFSATLYYFGRKLHQDLDVPIGLINSSWGGSPIEPWFAKNGKMYNAMIAPLHNFALKGFTWYQGETNVIKKNGLTYHDKKKELIEGWRAKWNDQSLPFYYVQIAPWSGKRYEPGQLPALWEAQTKSLSIPKTGMAVTTDIVHKISDIHPKNKLDVGERLARWALVKDYGKEMVYSGPIYKSMKIDGSKIVISFAHVGSGLVSRDGKELNEFQIAGADGKYVAAKAKIVGETVIVEASEVSSPKNVRFGWHKVANPNLMNKEKLPASPFQTDNWQGKTGE